MHEDLCYQTIAELSGQISAGALSPVELTRAYIERAEDLDARIRSIITLLPEHAIRRAEEAEREVRRGMIRSPLHGIPYGVKDLLDTRGIKTTWGSIIFKDRVPDRDSAVVENLDRAGGVLMAKLAMSEFAGGATRSNLIPYARNPWKLDRTTSGSSSGSGGSTSSALVGFSIGSETGGSIVGPSSACGVSGMRTTYGRVSRFGCMTLAWSLDKLGPIARSAVDCGLVLEAIAGPDPRDLRTSTPFRFRRDPGPVAGKKIGIVREEFEVRDDFNRRVFADALDVLEQAGYRFEDVTLPDRPYAEVYNLTSNSEGGTSFKPLFNDKRIEGMYTGSRRAAWMAASMLPASDYLTAQRIRQLIVNESNQQFSNYDAVISPTRGSGAGLVEPPANDDRPAPDRPNAPSERRGPVLTRLANLAGLPGISIPCGFDEEGLPLALHIVAKAWGEQAVLDVAMAYQRETDHHRQRPSFRP